MDGRFYSETRQLSSRSLYATLSDFHLHSNIALFSIANKSSDSDERLLLIRDKSFFVILLLPLLSVFNSRDAALLIFLHRRYLATDLLFDMPSLLHSSLSTIDVLLCSY